MKVISLRDFPTLITRRPPLLISALPLIFLASILPACTVEAKEAWRRAPYTVEYTVQEKAAPVGGSFRSTAVRWVGGDGGAVKRAIGHDSYAGSPPRPEGIRDSPARGTESG